MDLSCRNNNERRPEWQYDMPEGGQLGTVDVGEDKKPRKARKDNLPLA